MGIKLLFIALILISGGSSVPRLTASNSLEPLLPTPSRTKTTNKLHPPSLIPPTPSPAPTSPTPATSAPPQFTTSGPTVVGVGVFGNGAPPSIDNQPSVDGIQASMNDAQQSSSAPFSSAALLITPTIDIDRSTSIPIPTGHVGDTSSSTPPILKTRAFVGIAVAVIALVLLSGSLFFIRRRRREGLPGNNPNEIYTVPLSSHPLEEKASHEFIPQDTDSATRHTSITVETATVVGSPIDTNDNKINNAVEALRNYARNSRPTREESSKPGDIAHDSQLVDDDM